MTEASVVQIVKCLSKVGVRNFLGSISIGVIASSTDDFLIICGDFNAPEIEWTSNFSRKMICPLLDWSMDKFLNQHVSKPTRPKSQSVLDLVFSSIATRVENVLVRECFGSSDHAIVSFSTNFPRSDSSSAVSSVIP